MADSILALNGVHTAGKSSLGEMLEEREGLNYFPEVAQKLIDEEGADWGEEGDHAFQSAIHEEEASRDRDILDGDLDHAVVETWHFGNLAHSMETAREGLVRDQNEYIQVVSEETDTDIYAVFFNMPLENIWNRSPHFEEGDDEILDFYDRVRDNHFQIYSEHGIEHVVIENDEKGLEEAYSQVRDFAYEVLEQ